MSRDENLRVVHRRKPVKGILLKIISFILGLSVSTGVIYVFTVGNTPVYIGYFFAALVFIGLLLKNPHRIVRVISAIDISVLVFFGLATLSFIPSFIYCLVGQVDINVPLTVLKGLIVLIAGLIVYIVTLSIRRYRKAIVYGVAFGIIINVVISIIAQIAFESGTVFSLVSLFPQDAFAVSMKWGVSAPAHSHAIYVFRAQGLFLEASHLMVFLVTWGLLCLRYVRYTFAKAVILIGICYIMAQSLSPNAAILIVEGVLIILLSKSHNAGLKKKSSVRRTLPYATIFAILVLILIGGLACIRFSSIIAEAVDSVIDSFTDLDPMSSTDTGTLDRFNSMVSTVSILPNYPFGAGWNTESLILTSHFDGTVFASHSFALRLLLELGPLGLIAYCWVIMRHAKGAFHASQQGRVVGIAIVCMAMTQFMNGITLLPYVWVILGLSKDIELDKKVVRVKLSNVMYLKEGFKKCLK